MSRRMTEWIRAVAVSAIALLVVGTCTADEAQAASKVTLCHATHSDTNPYVQITVAAAAAYNGHLGDGHQDGEDIIPPFEYRGETYSQNWDVEGQAIFGDGCEVPVTPSPTPSPTVSPTVSPSPSPSSSPNGSPEPQEPPEVAQNGSQSPQRGSEGSTPVSGSEVGVLVALIVSLVLFGGSLVWFFRRRQW